MSRVALPEGSFLPVHLLPSGSDFHDAVVDAAGQMLVFRRDGSGAKLLKPTYGVAKGLLRATDDAFWIVNSDGDVERCDASGCVVSEEKALKARLGLGCQYGMCAAVADGKLSLFRSDGNIVRLEASTLGAVWDASPMNASTVLVWHAGNVASRWDLDSPSPEAGLRKLADATRFFSPLADGTLMSISDNREILRLDLDGNQIGRVARLPSPHRAAWGSGYGLAGQLEDGTLFGVSASGLKLVRGFAEEALAIRLLPGARALLLVDRTARVRLIDLDGGNAIASWQLVGHDLQSAWIDRGSGDITVVSQQGEIAIGQFDGYLLEDGLPPLPDDPIDPAGFVPVQVEPLVDRWFVDSGAPPLSETARVIEAVPEHGLLVVAEGDEIQVRAGSRMARHSPSTAETLLDAGRTTLWMGGEGGLIEVSLQNGIAARRWRIGAMDSAGGLASPVALADDSLLIEQSGRWLVLSPDAMRLIELEPPGKFINALDKVAQLEIQGDLATLRTNSCKWLRYSMRTGARLATATGECPSGREEA